MARIGRSSIWACWRSSVDAAVSSTRSRSMRTPRACDAGVMLHGKLRLWSEPFLLAGRGQFQGGHDQAGEGAAGGQVLGPPRLGVGRGEVERADGAVALAHRHTQPRPQASRDHQLPERRPASLGGKIGAGHRLVLDERLNGWPFVIRELGAAEQAAAPGCDGDVVQLVVGAEEEQADAAGAATAGGGGLDDLIEHGLEAELDRVQARQPAQVSTMPSGSLAMDAPCGNCTIADALPTLRYPWNATPGLVSWTTM
jgi:hypothetical protein